MLQLLALAVAMVSLWHAFRLFRGRPSNVLALYRGAPANQGASILRQHAWLLTACGVWFLAVFVGAIFFLIPLLFWVGLYLAGPALFYIGKRVIEHKHGVPRS